MDSSGKSSKQSIWTRDIDPFPKWRSGEFVEPEPGSRKRYLLTVGMPCLIAAVAAICAEPFVAGWLRSYILFLSELAKTDPDLAAEKGAELLRWLGWSLSLIGSAASICLFANSVRLLRAGRNPLPGKRVLRRTEIVRGPLLKLQTGLAIVFSAIMLVASIYGGLYMHRMADKPGAFRVGVLSPGDIAGYS